MVHTCSMYRVQYAHLVMKDFQYVVRVLGKGLNPATIDRLPGPMTMFLVQLPFSSAFIILGQMVRGHVKSKYRSACSLLKIYRISDESEELGIRANAVVVRDGSFDLLTHDFPALMYRWHGREGAFP